MARTVHDLYMELDIMMRRGVHPDTPLKFVSTDGYDELVVQSIDGFARAGADHSATVYLGTTRWDADDPLGKTR